MPNFIYTGDAPNGTIVMYGVTFTPGEASEVTDGEAVRKLRGNRFFEEVGSAVVEPEVPVKKKAKAKKEAVADGNPDETPVV